MTEVGSVSESLEVLARKIEEHSRQLDTQSTQINEFAQAYYGRVLATALLVRDARARVEVGEAGSVTWHEWARKNIKVGPSRFHELQAIAASDDPAKEVERLRKRTLARVQKHRQKQATAMREPERRLLMGWVRKAPMNEVRRVLRVVDIEADQRIAA